MTAETTTILSYNVASALSDGQKALAVLEQIDFHQPTVAIFPEAYLVGDGGINENFLADLQSKKRDYVFAQIDQEVSDRRPDARGLLIIAKRELTTGLGPVKLSGRFAMTAQMYDPASGEPFTFFGQHGNDKNEQLRIEDTRAFLDHYLPLETDDTGVTRIARPTAVAGDFNSMNPKGFLPRALRALGPAVNALPSVSPNPSERQPWLKRNASTAQRLSQMAIGTPLAMLSEVGLEDIDDTNEPTMRKMGIAVKLDHILTSRHFETVGHRVVRGLTVDGDVNGEPLSDHDLIVGALYLPTQPSR
ncbi:MAG: hypothetical protein JWN82_261 [Candidatus Saccharibacteria bacterium]|nr:hypothetical protein [Candidatus Saccharibacteria bacterium]